MAVEISMQQNVNIMLVSLARTFPNAKVVVSAVGPISIKNGLMRCGTATKTEVQLADIKRKELSAHVSLGELRAEATYTKVKQARRQAGRGKALALPETS